MMNKVQIKGTSARANKLVTKKSDAGHDTNLRARQSLRDSFCMDPPQRDMTMRTSEHLSWLSRPSTASLETQTRVFGVGPKWLDWKSDPLAPGVRRSDESPKREE